MGYIFSGLVSLAVAMLAFALQSVMKENSKLKHEKEQDQKVREDSLETGVRQLLSVRLEEIYDQYEDKEEIPLRVYDRWMKLHKAYKGLHGNGTFDHMKLEMEEKHLI